MLIRELIAEAVTDNVVYHATTLQGLKGMIQTGAIQPSSAETAHGWGGGGGGDHGSVSLTRDRNYFPFDFTDVQLTLNRDALAQNFRIQPYNFAGRYESEERVDRPIPLTSRYVRSISYRNRSPSKPMLAALKKLGIPVEPYRELPGVNRRYDYTINPADYGDQKLDWKITDQSGDLTYRRLSNLTAAEAKAEYEKYEHAFTPLAQRGNPDYPKRYRLLPDRGRP
jgi:hypothetical protein